MADEATDVSHNKQLSICLRLVDDQCEIKEFFMGFLRLYRFDAANLAKEISDFLSKHNISFSMCIAQCYDGYIQNNLNNYALSSFLLQSCCYGRRTKWSTRDLTEKLYATWHLFSLYGAPSKPCYM